MLIDLDYSWHLMRSPVNGLYYVKTSLRYRGEDGKMHGSTLFLESLLLGVTHKIHIDHEDHNTLNNRRYNLRITTPENNLRNRKSKNKNNKSGYRNVCWIEDCRKWCVQLQINGRNTMLGKFDDVDKAGEFAEQKRKEIYGEFAGVS